MALDSQPAPVASAEKRQFTIKACLGRGGFGEVYRASMTHASGLETEVAVKVLHADLEHGAQGVERLRDEARMLGALVHGSILRVFDLVVLDGRVGLVTEYIEGQDLSRCIRGPDRMPPRALVAVIGRVADALRAAWETRAAHVDEPLHLIHRDIKPQNIRIGKSGDVKLLDFGVARSAHVGREAQTGTGHMVGSYLYMAPECLLENRFGPESDVFALGATLFEALADTRLFHDLSLREVYVLVLQEEVYDAHIRERLEALDAPAPLVELLAQMLRPAPEARPTAAEIAARCEDLVDALDGPTLRRWCAARAWPEQERVSGLLDGRTITEATIAATVPPGLRERAGPARARVGWGAWIGAGVALVAITSVVIAAVVVAVGGGALWLQRSDAPVVFLPEPELILAIDGAGYATPTRDEVEVEVDASPGVSPPSVQAWTNLIFSSRPDRIPMRLRRDAAVYVSLDRVPMGSYALEVDWRGEGWSRVFEVRTRPGTTHIDCNRLTRVCEVK